MPSLIEFPVFLPNKSIVLNKPEEFLKAQFSVGDSRNMEFANENLASRLGLVKFSLTQLSGAVLLKEQFWKFDSTWFLMICATKDIYKYDFVNYRFDILTPLYTTGTITISAGTPTIVTGLSTVWATNLKTGDFIKIGSGSAHTGSIWYEILTVNSDTQLTLKTAAADCSASAYVSRQCFTGSAKDFWHARTFNDKNLGETWIAVNGVDKPIRWNGTGQVSFLTGLPSGFTTAKFIEIYKDRVIFLWTIEGGQNQPQRERWSEVADCQTYDVGDFRDFMDDNYWITGSCLFLDYHIVMRERDAWVGRFVGGDFVFDYERSNSCVGLWGFNSIVVIELEIYYYGPDNKFHKWNTLRDIVISETIFSYTKEFNPNMEQYIFGYHFEAKNQIRWFVPYGDTEYMNDCIVYDYNEEIIQIWKYEKPQALCSIGEYLNIANIYCDDPIWGEFFCDETSGFCDDRVFLDSAPVIIFGGNDGYIRLADKSFKDDGIDYNRVFESVRMNFKAPSENKRLWRQQWWFENEPTGNVTVKLKKDDKNVFESETKTISLVSITKDKIKQNITWDKEAQNFKMQISSTTHFSLLGFINYLFLKGKTFR